jgi:hypothetical protein
MNRSGSHPNYENHAPFKKFMKAPRLRASVRHGRVSSVSGKTGNCSRRGGFLSGAAEFIVIGGMGVSIPISNS